MLPLAAYVALRCPRLLGVIYYARRRMLLLVASCDMAAGYLHQSLDLGLDILAPSARDGLASADAFAGAGARTTEECYRWHMFPPRVHRVAYSCA